MLFTGGRGSRPLWFYVYAQFTCDALLAALTDLSIAPELSLCFFLLCSPQGCINNPLWNPSSVLSAQGMEGNPLFSTSTATKRVTKRTKVPLMSQPYHIKMWGFFIRTLKAAILCSMLVHSRLIVQKAFGTDLPSDPSTARRPDTTCTLSVVFIVFIHCSIHLLSYLAG